MKLFKNKSLIVWISRMECEKFIPPSDDVDLRIIDPPSDNVDLWIRCPLFHLRDPLCSPHSLSSQIHRTIKYSSAVKS